MYPKFLIFKLPNFSIKDASSFCKSLFRTPINKRHKELQYNSKQLSISEKFISKQFSTSDLKMLEKSLISYKIKSLQKSLYTQQKKLPLLTRCWSLPVFTASKTITNLTQNKSSQKESNLLKTGLYFLIQPDKIQKSEIFTSFEEIHCYFINNLRSVETKSQIKAHLLYLAYSYLYNYKPFPRILRQHSLCKIP